MSQLAFPERPPAERRFELLSRLTVGIVYLLILAGGIVRATGSGMGCPDWPRCFGQWVPPTHEHQLPLDYQTRYAGLHGNVESFNAAKTWTEYINRLLGALTGLVVAALFLASLPLRKKVHHLPFLTGAVVVLTGIEGWLGKVVVERNLHEGTVTLHMLLAMLIVGLVILAAVRLRATPAPPFQGVPSWLPGVALGLVLVQLVLGTQVREAVDALREAPDPGTRSTWLAQIGLPFYVHRSFSWGIVAVFAVLVWKMRSHWHDPAVWQVLLALGASNALALAGGLVLAYGGLPVWVQPFHLLMGSLVVGSHLFALVRVMESKAIASAAA